MRILAVTPWFPTADQPGAGIFNLRDAELLARTHAVSVLHLVPPGTDLTGPTPGNDSDIDVYRVHFSLSRPDTFRGALRALRKLAGEADLVHTMAFPALFPVKWARLRLPWVHTEHWSALVSEGPTIAARFGAKFLRGVLASPDAVVAVGSDLATAIEGYRDVPTPVIANRVAVMEPGQVADPPPDPKRGALRLVAVGSLISRKGPLQAVEALAELVRRGVEAKLEWIGAGELHDAVLHRADTLGVRERVTLPGHLDPERMVDSLLGSHVFLLPTSGETFGVAVAEALGSGLPVVVTGVGGHLEFLPERASRFVGRRTGADLAEAVLDLISDPERLSGEEIRTFAEQRFSEKARGRAYAKIYESVLTQRQVAL